MLPPLTVHFFDNQTKQTPLHLAAENGQFQVCETLLQLGADGTATTDEGKKAVHLAAMHDHSEVVKLFLRKSPEVVSTADKVGVGMAFLFKKLSHFRVFHRRL